MIATRDMAANAGITPCAAKRPGNALPAQIDGNGLRAFTGREFAEDAADGVGFLRHNLSVAPDRFAVGIDLLHHLVAVAKPAACLPLLHPAPQTAMGLHRKVFQEQGIHRAFQTDMKLGDFPFSQGNDGDTRKLQMLVESGDIGLIAADPVQSLSQQYLELSALHVPHKPLDAGTQDSAGTRYGRVLVGTDDLPLLPARMFPAKPELVLDRRLALAVG